MNSEGVSVYWNLHSFVVMGEVASMVTVRNQVLARAGTLGIDKAKADENERTQRYLVSGICIY